MIDIIKVSNDSELREFVMFPFRLYKGSKYWVPPIINQEIENFDLKINNEVCHKSSLKELVNKNCFLNEDLNTKEAKV